ncbi:hypothetical protein ACIQU6_43310 [Streptomyces sp. NPDC090442]|uniref:hypothetical protein n=1 Tax=Streptomyces sp. NPDC090442 TaxID=3365962 RepID=UPI0037FFC323
MNHTTAVHETVTALRSIRERWAELLNAVEAPPADVWPPRQLAHTLRAVDEEQLDVVDRAPLVLREHPAPLNVPALDTRIAVERTLFDLADTLAAAVQHAEPGDPNRWDYRSPTSPGTRAHGLPYATRWIEGRLRDEQTAPEAQRDGTLAPPRFAPLPPYLLHEARRTIRGAHSRMLRTLGIDQPTAPIPGRPCPWCGGDLLLHQNPNEPTAVTCETGAACTAPVSRDEQGRRTWTGEQLLGLEAALNAGGRHANAA